MVNLGKLVKKVLYVFEEMYNNIENNTVSIEDINSLTTLLIDYDSITTAELLQRYQNNKKKCHEIIGSRTRRDDALNSILKIDINLLQSITQFRNSLCHLEYLLYGNRYIDNNVDREFILDMRDIIETSNLKELATENGIVKEVKIIVIKDYLNNILFEFGGINYVK